MNSVYTSLLLPLMKWMKRRVRYRKSDFFSSRTGSQLCVQVYWLPLAVSSGVARSRAWWRHTSPENETYRVVVGVSREAKSVAAGHLCQQGEWKILNKDAPIALFTCDSVSQVWDSCSNWLFWSLVFSKVKTFHLFRFLFWLYIF